MKPRIYVYKITFREVPNFYYGYHKEKLFEEAYWGSPKGNKEFWSLYTPLKDIISVYPYSDEGEVEAMAHEDYLIKANWKNPLILNEHCSGGFHPEAIRRLWKNPDHREKMSSILRERNLGRWQDIEYRERMSRASRERWGDEMFKDRMSEVFKSVWEDYDLRERTSQAGLERWKNDQYRNMVSEAMKEGWKDPRIREKAAAAKTGALNPAYGKMWITNGTKEGTKLVPKDSPIPEGFRKGRTTK